MAPCTLLDLPTEILVAILEAVGASSPLDVLLSCQRVCRRLHALVTRTAALRSMLWFAPQRTRRRSAASARDAELELEAEGAASQPRIARVWFAAMLTEKARRAEAVRTLVGAAASADLNALLVPHFAFLLRPKLFPKQALDRLRRRRSGCEVCEGPPRRDVTAGLRAPVWPWEKALAGVFEAAGRVDGGRVWLRPEASWRRMLVSRYPITRVALVRYRFHDCLGKGDRQLLVETVDLATDTSIPRRYRADERDGSVDERAPCFLTMGYYCDLLLSRFCLANHTHGDWALFVGKRPGKRMRWPNLRQVRDETLGGIWRRLIDAESQCVLITSECGVDHPAAVAKNTSAIGWYLDLDEID